MTDKWLTWERQVGSGVELPAYLPCVPSQTFPQKQKELSVLLVAQRKTLVMELDSPCGATTLLPKDGETHEHHCNANTDWTLIDCCLHSVACLQTRKKSLDLCLMQRMCFGTVPSLMEFRFLKALQYPSHSAVVLSSGPKENSKQQQTWAKVFFVPSPAAKCKRKYFYPRNEVWFASQKIRYKAKESWGRSHEADVSPLPSTHCVLQHRLNPCRVPAVVAPVQLASP